MSATRVPHHIILFIGSRWPLLCIGAFVIAKVFQNLILGKYQVGTLIISICFLGLIIYFLPKLIFVISVILERMGISSRTINMLISDRIMSDSGRSVIRSNLIEQLNKSPFWGYGAFGSVIALNDETAHNFILDIMANFGYIIGSAIIISSILATIKTIKNTNNSAIRELVLIYSAMIWPKATVGGSFWVAEAYWMLIGLFILNRKLQNKSKIRDNLQ